MGTPTFRCSTCDELHEGVPSFGADAPAAYETLSQDEREERVELSSDQCVIDGDEFYLRGCLEVPIHGSDPFVWGVWVSLSKQSFERVSELWETPGREKEPPYFGWLSTRLPCYPNTLLLKTHVHMRPVGQRPLIELEPTEHPLAVAQQEGISLEKAQEIIERVLHPERGRLPPLVRHVYHEHVAHFGEPDRSLVYDPESATSPSPLLRTDVMIWRPTEEADLTTLATIGMCARTMPNCSLRAELHLTVRGSLDEAEEGRLATLLANLSCYPWDIDGAIDWWHMLGAPCPIPAFPRCSALLLHPPFVERGWAEIDHEGQKVRILNVVPITAEERAALREDRDGLLDRWAAARVDVFSDRAE